MLEIAIVLAIMGIISGFCVTKFISVNKILKVQMVKNNIEVTTLALAAFVANNNRLPKPDKNNSGIENDYCNNTSNFFGQIPYKTLGISRKHTLDGNAKPLVYAVNKELTASNLSSIAQKEMNENHCFCKTIMQHTILLNNFSIKGNNVIAYVLDVIENVPKINTDEISFTESATIFWIYRDMLLMKYLKMPPCKSSNNNAQNVINEEFNF